MVGKPPKLTLVAEYDVMESALENKSQNESADSDDANSKSSFDIFYDMTVGAAPVYEAGKMPGMSSEEAVDMLLELVAKNTANQGFQRIKCFNFSSQAGRLLRDILNTTNPALVLLRFGTASGFERRPTSRYRL
jgi:hypothetical protein